MANILPMSTELPEQQEYKDITTSFTASLDIGESLVSINITDRIQNDGISVSGASYSGQYRNSFSFGQNALHVRMRSNGEIRQYCSWESLPPPQECDIVQWNAPSSLTTTYTYTVELVYLYSPSQPTTPPTAPVEKRLTKTYSQVVFGDYDVWSRQLREYVSNSGDFPTRK